VTARLAQLPKHRVYEVFLNNVQYPTYGSYNAAFCMSAKSIENAKEHRTHGDYSGMDYIRGGQLDQLWETNFRRLQSARAIYSTLKFIESKF
jgi:hypothetical protein